MSNEFFKEWSVKFTNLLILDFGLSPLDCHAVMGNAGCESAGFKSLQEIKPLVKGSAGGFGIMQWTGPRRRLYEAYCARNNLKPTDMMSNYKFLFVELSGSEGKDGKVLQRVKAAGTLEAKTEVFMKEFLRPGVPHLDSRISWAKIAKAAYSSAGTPVPSEPVVEEPVVVDPVPDQTVPQSPRGTSLVTLLISILQALFGKK